MMVNEQEIEITTPDGQMPAFVATPGGGPSPVVLVYMDALGLREVFRDVGRRLAGAGFYAIVPDLFYRFGSGIVFDPEKIGAGDEDEFGRLIETMQRLTDEMAMTDTRAVLAHAAEDDAARDGEKGCMGFCMGGRFVLRAMQQLPGEFAAGSALHPSFLVAEGDDSPHLACATITGELYLGYGAEDQFTPLATAAPMREELERHGIAHEIGVHEGANHGYMLPGEPAYLETAAEQAWARTISLFQRKLGAAAVA
jgi:carboxymethylenebutenolidase